MDERQQEKRGSDSSSDTDLPTARQKPSAIKGPTVKEKRSTVRTKHRNRKAKDAPRRPLSAYTTTSFFLDERLKIVAEHDTSKMQHSGQDSLRGEEEEKKPPASFGNLRGDFSQSFGCILASPCDIDAVPLRLLFYIVQALRDKFVSTARQ